MQIILNNLLSNTSNIFRDYIEANKSEEDNGHSYLIYAHTSPSSKRYIGQTKNYDYRCKQHQTTNKCPAFNNAINYYGWDNFIHEILEENLTLNDANLWEKCHIFINNSFGKDGYNLTSGGENYKLSEETKQKIRISNIGKIFSEETKQKMSESAKVKIFTETHRENIGNTMSGENHWNWGLHHSEETKQKMSDARTQFYIDNPDKIVKGENHYLWGKFGELHHGYGRLTSEETKQQMSKSQIQRFIEHPRTKGEDSPFSKYYIITFPGGNEQLIRCLKQFCKENNLDYSAIHRVIKGVYKQTKGFRCRYATDEEITSM